MKLKKAAGYALGLLCMILLSFGAELLVFHLPLLFKEKEERGMFELDFWQLEPTGLVNQTGGVFLPNGEDIGFGFEDTIYIHDLEITTTPDTPPMMVEVSGVEGSFALIPGERVTTVIPVRQNARDVYVRLIPRGEFSRFEISNIVIDNTITVNYLRVACMAVLLAAGCRAVRKKRGGGIHPLSRLRRQLSP